MKRAVYVVGCGALSAVAANVRDAHKAFERGVCFTTPEVIGGQVRDVGRLCARAEGHLAELSVANHYANLDRSVQLGLLAAREAITTAKLGGRETPVGVIVASSRGATETLEHRHSEFLSTGRARALSSPTTTLGNLSSTIAQELACAGVAEAVSSACTGSLHALLLGVAWLRAGMGDACLVGGAEAPLTPFTLAQFSVLGLLGQGPAEQPPPCRPLANDLPNRLVLGEGASILALESLSPRGAELRGAIAELRGVGASIERAKSPTGITEHGDALAASMARALAEHGDTVDAVVVHAPGTRNGDLAELSALRRVFGTSLPALCSNKWQMGHTFGASGALGVEFALALLAGVRPAEPPYASALRAPPREVRSVLINAAGFGGSAASVVLGRLQ
jgi:3-oxoacyl-(acyl-carrier-protein) synthase